MHHDKLKVYSMYVHALRRVHSVPVPICAPHLVRKNLTWAWGFEGQVRI